MSEFNAAVIVGLMSFFIGAFFIYVVFKGDCTEGRLMVFGDKIYVCKTINPGCDDE